MAYETILYEPDAEDAFVTVTMNRPDKLNALNGTLLDELDDAVKRASADPKINALLLTGTGRAFSTGYDLGAENYDMSIEDWRADILANAERLYTIWSAPIATVAAVNGYALAGGMELMMACDIAIAAEDAGIGEPEIRHASAPPSLLMPWTAPIRHVKYLMFTGDIIDGREAARYDLVNKAVPAADLMAEATRLTRRLARVPVPGIKFNKLAVNNAQLVAGLRDSWAYNAETTAQLHCTDEGRRWFRMLFEEGLKAFLDAREGPFRALEKDGA